MIKYKENKNEECFNLNNYKSCLKIYLNKFILELQDLEAPEEIKQTMINAADIVDQYN